MLNVIESEKKAMPNDIANLGWRATAKTGANIGRSHPAASFQEMPSLRARLKPTESLVGFLQQRPTNRTGPGVRLEGFQSAPTQRLLDGLAQQRLKLSAFHTVFALSRHHITCL